MKQPSYVEFEHDKYPWKPDIDYRKNPHMGFTRSRRYWNHSSGKKWTNDGGWKVLPYDRTEQRFYDSSLIFQKYWKMARENEDYLQMKKQHRSL